MATKKMSAKKKKGDGTTIVGALSRTGPSVHQNPGASGGPITRVDHKTKVKKKVKNSGMTVAATIGDLGDASHFLG